MSSFGFVSVETKYMHAGLFPLWVVTLSPNIIQTIPFTLSSSFGTPVNLAFGLVREMKIRFAVLINKSYLGYDMVENLCDG